MKVNTHLEIDRALCGEPTELGDGRATVTLHTAETMKADAEGLVHGGFVFGAADYAAMLAVNDPNVVLGAAEAKFLKPVRCGQTVVAYASVLTTEGKTRVVEVTATVDRSSVFEGSFTCFVLDQHVLAAQEDSP